MRIALAALPRAGARRLRVAEHLGDRPRDATRQQLDARRRAEVHTSLAGEYYQRGAIGVALQETRLAIKDDPNYVTACEHAGPDPHGAARGRQRARVLRPRAAPRAEQLRGAEQLRLVPVPAQRARARPRDDAARGRRPAVSDARRRPTSPRACACAAPAAASRPSSTCAAPWLIRPDLIGAPLQPGRAHLRARRGEGRRELPHPLHAPGRARRWSRWCWA